MTDVLSPETPNGFAQNVESAASADSKQVTQFRERDEVFWTELEIRRLGNLVAECIHAHRYIGDSKNADEGRKQMRTYIDAMKRKSMRVLHKAELYAKSGHASWPGIDPTITDPVSLAEEYVRVVQNYEAVLSEEESRVKQIRSENRVEDNGLDAIQAEIETEDWETEDEIAYKEALKREKELAKSADDARKELLGTEEEGIRRRKGAPGPSNQTATYSKEEEELMAHHQPIQDELTSNLVDLVGQLKKSISENKEKLDRDNKVIDETEDAVEKNLSGVAKQRTELKKFSQSSTVSWWVMMIAVIAIIVVFALVLVLLRVPM